MGDKFTYSSRVISKILNLILRRRNQSTMKTTDTTMSAEMMFTTARGETRIGIPSPPTITPGVPRSCTLEISILILRSRILRNSSRDMGKSMIFGSSRTTTAKDWATLMWNLITLRMQKTPCATSMAWNWMADNSVWTLTEERVVEIHPTNMSNATITWEGMIIITDPQEVDTATDFSKSLNNCKEKYLWIF